MNDLKMNLRDGTEVEIDSFSLPLHIVATRDTQMDAIALWSMLTPINIENITIYDGDERTAKFANCVLTSVQFVPFGEKITAHFFMRGENRSDDREDAE